MFGKKPYKKKPIKRASTSRRSEANKKKFKRELRKSDRFALSSFKNVAESKATAAARKSVALINAIEIENKVTKTHSKGGIEIMDAKSDLKLPNGVERAPEDMSVEIVIRIEIERVEMSELAALAVEALEGTPDSTPSLTTLTTPTTPQSPPDNFYMATSLPSMLSRGLRHAELLPFEHDPEVLAYFRERELSNRPKPNYLQQQPQIDRAARAFLVNWLVVITRERELDTETLYHAVSYIDRFLSDVVIQRSKLQVVGVACLHIAVKFELSRPPPIAKLAAIGDVQLDVKQIIQMEEVVLKALSFDLRLPTAFTFVSAFAVATKVPNLLKYLAMYICELTLLEAEPYLHFLPSQVAAAAYALARYILGYDIWSELLADVTTCRLENLKKIFLCLSKTHACAAKILPKAIQMKYLEKEYNEVALMASVSVNDSLFDYLVDYYYSLGV